MKRLDFKILSTSQRIGVILAIVGLTAILAFAIPLSKDENLTRYSGAQRQVAEAALQNAHQHEISYYLKFLKVTIEDVQLKCGAEMKKNPKLYQDLDCLHKKAYDPKYPTSYMVTVAEWTLFGIKIREYTRNSVGIGEYS